MFLAQVLINAGQANAATGDAGYEDCLKSAEAVAQELGIDTDQVLIESTGLTSHVLQLSLQVTWAPAISTNWLGTGSRSNCSLELQLSAIH